MQNDYITDPNSPRMYPQRSRDQSQMRRDRATLGGETMNSFQTDALHMLKNHRIKARIKGNIIETVTSGDIINGYDALAKYLKITPGTYATHLATGKLVKILFPVRGDFSHMETIRHSDTGTGFGETIPLTDLIKYNGTAPTRCHYSAPGWYGQSCNALAVKAPYCEKHSHP